MLLVDTSVWLAHLRQENVGLQGWLQEGRVLCHPLIIGELACGNLKNRPEFFPCCKRCPRPSGPKMTRCGDLSKITA